MGTRNTVCVSTYNTPAQNSPTAIRSAVSTLLKYSAAHTK